jgi:hypothetical protein
MSAAIALISKTAPAAKPETVAQRIVRLQNEAKTLARENVVQFTNATAVVQDMAMEIAQGGDASPAGVRDLARRLVDDIEARVASIQAITGRMY